MSLTHPRYVNFEAIDVDPAKNVRFTYDGIDALAESIKRDGLLQPLVVYERRLHAERRYTLVAGYRRHKAITRLRLGDSGAFAEVPAIVKQGNAADAVCDNLSENIERRSLTPGEIAKGLAALDAMGIQQAEIARRTGLSTSYVSNLLRCRKNLAPAALEAFEGGLLAVDVAMALTELEPDEQTRRIEQVQATASSNGHHEPERASVRRAARDATRKRPTGATLKAEIAKLPDADGGFWYGVRQGLEFAAGTRKRIQK